jgi:penicillin amidase
VLVSVVVVAGGAALWVGWALKASLPRVEGELPLPGLAEPVRVERDARGVPVVRGSSRLDVARATGFLHAQDRFFQMDLLRRRAAGELSEIFGEFALEMDREVRPLRLRRAAHRAMASISPRERAMVDAYSEGVNAGLQTLGATPFEYRMLRVEPQPWLPADTGLCVMGMFLTLQQRQPGRESALGLMHDLLPPELVEFLAPRGTEWDAPLEGAPFSQPPVPGPEVLDLRLEQPGALARISPDAPAAAFEPDAEDALVYGSNNWAVAGTHTAHGGALLANDMHLGLDVPNIWYRASLVFPAPEGERRVTGVMLPGVPFVVVGSNGHVAWGFTNSQGDWSDLVVLEIDPDDPGAYLTPEGPRAFERATETIRIRGGEEESLEVLSTIWGPVVDEDHRGRRRALRWVPLLEGGLDTDFSRMEDARDVDEALTLAAEVGIPHQNLVCADSSGRIGWTIVGRIPRRVGFDGRLPGPWADGSRGWDGWLDGEEYPRIVDPPSGRIWTANARVVSGERLDTLGFGGYALGARARQIRDDLMDIEAASETDMLGVQLDDRAVFLERWRDLLLEVLDAETTGGHPERAEARRWIEAWGGRAGIDSVGYRLVRAFRSKVARASLEPLVAPCREADERFDGIGQATRQWEGPLWALVTERPLHLLDPRYPGWPALLVAALDETLEEILGEKEGGLAERTWGEHNTVLIRHTLSYGAPALRRWLDMPREALAGDTHMPRVQTPRSGASERLAVSPGREAEGYFHMPGGQSGHPLSPHYGDGHGDWARGDPAPFLPGPPAHVLTLLPSVSDEGDTGR